MIWNSITRIIAARIKISIMRKMCKSKLIKARIKTTEKAFKSKLIKTRIKTTEKAFKSKLIKTRIKTTEKAFKSKLIKKNRTINTSWIIKDQKLLEIHKLVWKTYSRVIIVGSDNRIRVSL
jgi:hypothetical protein